MRPSDSSTRALRLTAIAVAAVLGGAAGYGLLSVLQSSSSSSESSASPTITLATTTETATDTTLTISTTTPERPTTPTGTTTPNTDTTTGTTTTTTTPTPAADITTTTPTPAADTDAHGTTTPTPDADTATVDTTTTTPTERTTTTTVAAPASVFDEVAQTDLTGGVANWTVEIVERVPHDPDAFTQGLEIAGGVMYESTGLYGKSSLRAVDSVSGAVTSRISLPEDLFGEGLTVVDDRLVQLTWKSGTAFVYDRDTFERVAEHSYEGEGWGLCRMGDTLWMSDGSDVLTRRSPSSFQVIETVTVTSFAADMIWRNLNELECIGQRVIANIWQTDKLVVIDVSEPGQARVEAVISAARLVDDARQASPDRRIDVLNGVADPRDGSGTLWLTGKLWPYLYRVRIVNA